MVTKLFFLFLVLLSFNKTEYCNWQGIERIQSSNLRVCPVCLLIQKFSRIFEPPDWIHGNEEPPSCLDWATIASHLLKIKSILKYNISLKFTCSKIVIKHSCCPFYRVHHKIGECVFMFHLGWIKHTVSILAREISLNAF